jgi:hypothetical protein
MAKETFGRMSARLAVLLTMLASFAVTGVSWAAERIGVASGVVNKVTATLGSALKVLRVGDSLFQNQVVETETASSTQLLFQDETALTVGPGSRVVLDTYVYDARRKTGNIVLNATKGAFRFVSGSAQSASYKIRTPVASIGVRGTIFSWLITASGDLIAVLEEGSIEVCNAAGQCVVVDAPGQAIIIRADGTIEGPFDANGQLWNVTAGVPLPLFGREFINNYSDKPRTITPQDLNDAVDNAGRVIIVPPEPPSETPNES